jgi:hypothetical protein
MLFVLQLHTPLGIILPLKGLVVLSCVWACYSLEIILIKKHDDKNENPSKIMTKYNDNIMMKIMKMIN